MPKKLIKTILINTLILIILFFSLEVYSHKKEYNRIKNVLELQSKLFPGQPRSNLAKYGYKIPKLFNYENYKKQLRTVNYKNSKKRPVIFFGCSYTQGVGLTNEQTLAYKISNLTNRTTYNRGVGGTGTQFMYYQLNRNDLKTEIPDAEYIIYTFIWDHLYRLYAYELNFFGSDINLRYKIKNNRLVEISPSFMPFYALYTTKRIQESIKLKNGGLESCDYKMFNMIIKESIRLSKEKYPNSKFIMLTFPDSGVFMKNYVEGRRSFNKEEIKKLKEMGVILINAEELVGHQLRKDKYRVADKDHPSELSWDEIAPRLVKTLHL